MTKKPDPTRALDRVQQTTITYDRNLELRGQHLTLRDLKELVREANDRGMHDSSRVIPLTQASILNTRSITVMESS